MTSLHDRLSWLLGKIIRFSYHTVYYSPLVLNISFLLFNYPSETIHSTAALVQLYSSPAQYYLNGLIHNAGFQ